MMCLCVSACVLGFVTCFVCACCLHSFFSGGLSYAGMNGVLMCCACLCLYVYVWCTRMCVRLCVCACACAFV